MISQPGLLLQASKECALRQAAERGDICTLKYLVQRCSVNPDCSDDFGNTPLIQAVYFDRTEAVQALLEAGASARLRTISGDCLPPQP